MAKEGKRETVSSLPEPWGIVNDEMLVMRGYQRWKVTGVMPDIEDVRRVNPVWEADLMATWIASDFLEDAPAVAAETEGAITL